MSKCIIIIAGTQIAVQVLDTTQTRCVSGRIVESLPAEPNPLTSAQITEMVQAVYNEYRCRPTRDDIAWAVDKAGDRWCDATDERYVLRAVPTAVERADINRAARAEATDGLI